MPAAGYFSIAENANQVAEVLTIPASSFLIQGDCLEYTSHPNQVKKMEHPPKVV